MGVWRWSGDDTGLWLQRTQRPSSSCNLSRGRSYKELLHLIIICKLNILRSIYLCKVWMFCLHAPLCITQVPGELGCQKGTLDPLEQELQRVVNYHVGGGN